MTGAAALVATIVITSMVIVLSISIFTLTTNVNKLHRSFGDSVRTYYHTEAGLTDALFQLRKEPDNLLFNSFFIASSTIERFFVDTACQTNCTTILEAQTTSTESSELLQYYCQLNNTHI